jgi:hypothetical protein
MVSLSIAWEGARHRIHRAHRAGCRGGGVRLPGKEQKIVKALMIGREQAVVERMVSLVRLEGLNAAGTTSDEEAVTQLESGGVGGLVIGAGVEERSRQHLSTVATAQGVAVIGGALAGKDPQDYAREELVPQLRQVLR